MSARNYVETFGAGESKRLPAGRFFFVRVASGPIDIVTEGNAGAPVTFVGVGAGSKFGPVEPGEAWRFLRVTSASAQTVEIIISDDGDFDVANTVNVAGNVTVVESPASAIASPAGGALATGTQANIAANLSRRRLTIVNSSQSAGSLYVRDTAATTDAGIEIQPGMAFTFRTTAALRIVNNSGVNATYALFEET